MTFSTILLIAALISFLCGAFSVKALVNWDQLGKALVVAAVLLWGWK